LAQIEGYKQRISKKSQNLIRLPQDIPLWLVFVNTAKYFLVSYKAVKFFTSWVNVRFSRKKLPCYVSRQIFMPFCQQNLALWSLLLINCELIFVFLFSVFVTIFTPWPSQTDFSFCLFWKDSIRHSLIFYAACTEQK